MYNTYPIVIPPYIPLDFSKRDRNCASPLRPIRIPRKGRVRLEITELPVKRWTQEPLEDLGDPPF